MTWPAIYMWKWEKPIRLDADTKAYEQEIVIREEPVRGISIGKRIDPRTARKSDSPIFDALSRAIVEFAKAGVLPSDVRVMVIAPDVFDALWKEGKHVGSYEGEWLEFGSSLRVQRAKQ